jgi:endonuclease-3
MPRESKAARSERARAVVEALFAAHPDAHCALEYEDPFQLLCATILSAQCTDKMVNTVTPALFERFPDPAALAGAEEAELHELIRSTGFYKNKSKSLMGMARAVVERHDGRIPDRLGDLVKLPGVGRKTANVILGNAFGVPGLVVDTHVGRIAARLGLTKQTDAVKIEKELMPLVPEKDWTQFSHAMIFHGRRVCDARKPKCEECTLRPLCPYKPTAAKRRSESK